MARPARHGGAPVVFTGHLLKAGDAAPAVLAGAEREIASGIEAWLAAHPTSGAYTSLACGSDIIFADRVLAAGIPLHVALPFSVARFCEASVAIGNGPGIETDWVARYHRCLGAAASLSELWVHDIARGQTDYHYLNCSRHLAGDAILAAHRLSTAPRMLAVLHANAPETLAGSRNAYGAFAKLGFEADTIASPILRRPPVARQQGADPFTPVVFAFAQSGDDALLAEHGFRTLRTADGNMAYLRSRDFADARLRAWRLLRAARAAGTALRIVCDFGPVLDAAGAIDTSELVRLESARARAALPASDLFATSAFARQAAGQGDDPALYVPVALADGDTRQMYKVGQE